MKKYSIFALLFLFSQSIKAADKDSTVHYLIPDSLKAVQFMAEINVKTVNGKKEIHAGIQTDAVKLLLEGDKEGKEIGFEFPETAIVVASGLNTKNEKGEIEFAYDWSLNETYKLLISTASDSAGNFSLYSGYIFLPKENKWKLIGTCKIEGRWNSLQNPSSLYSDNINASTGQVWVQRNNGSWKNMKGEQQPNPVINLYAHIDSTQQAGIDNSKILEAFASGNSDATQETDGIFYSMMKEGTGRLVSINDTVVAYYKGYLFANDSVFDQTRDKPATFPLKRLIKGWQIGLPLCKVGGKIKLVIPSGLAYSIRTRAAKIPPNSILVFEIEVVDAKQ